LFKKNWECYVKRRVRYARLQIRKFQNGESLGQHIAQQFPLPLNVYSTYRNVSSQQKNPQKPPWFRGFSSYKLDLFLSMNYSKIHANQPIELFLITTNSHAEFSSKFQTHFILWGPNFECINFTFRSFF
jgi:hypothetical protein